MQSFKYALLAHAAHKCIRRVYTVTHTCDTYLSLYFRNFVWISSVLRYIRFANKWMNGTAVRLFECVWFCLSRISLLPKRARARWVTHCRGFRSTAIEQSVFTSQINQLCTRGFSSSSFSDIFLFVDFFSLNKWKKVYSFILDFCVLSQKTKSFVRAVILVFGFGLHKPVTRYLYVKIKFLFFIIIEIVIFGHYHYYYFRSIFAKHKNYMWHRCEQFSFCCVCVVCARFSLRCCYYFCFASESFYLVFV